MEAHILIQMDFIQMKIQSSLLHLYLHVIMLIPGEMFGLYVFMNTRPI